MINRYEQFTTSISCIYKIIQKIKRDGMAKYGLKGPHVQCLIAMHHNPDGLTISRLGELCDLDKAAISRAVAELENREIIEARQPGEKLYRAPLRLTKKGSQLSAEISEIAEQAVTQAGSGLSDQERKVFYSCMDRITENLQRMARDGILQNNSKGNCAYE